MIENQSPADPPTATPDSGASPLKQLTSNSNWPVGFGRLRSSGKFCWTSRLSVRWHSEWNVKNKLQCG
jgi:hypothetical protein